MEYAKTIDRLLQSLSQEALQQQNWDPWIRRKTDIYRAGSKDAFIGNGLIGLRIPPEGEPSVYPVFKAVKMAPGGTQMYGIWDENGLVPVFNFMGLQLSHGRMIFRRDSGAILNYNQELDWKTATVTTSCDWVHWGGTVHIDTKIYLSREKKHLGVLEMALTSDYDTTFVLKDFVDGSFIPGFVQGKFHSGNGTGRVLAFSGRINHRRLAAATAVSLNGELQTGEYHPACAGYERFIACPLKKGQTAFIIKTGALYSDRDAGDPVNAASTAAVFALENIRRIRELHEAAWQKLWENRIETSHPGVQMLLNNCLYQLYCNLDENCSGGVPGPCGLCGNAWNGHIFHDADMWTFPPIALLHPDLAANYIRYRTETLPGALRNAAAQGLTGAAYAWESGETGDELIPDLVYCKQIHINADVCHALRLFMLTSGENSPWQEKITDVITACADFFAARSVWNPEKQQYELRQVCCPDEFSGLVNNNAFTNYGAVFTLREAIRLAEKFHRPANPLWGKIAEKMWIPLDENQKIIQEYEGYNGQMIKQADAVLLIYPFAMPLSEEYRRNTCSYYLTRYHKQKIMMSSAIHGIIAAELGDREEAWRMFLDLLPHFRSEYMLASETPVNETTSLQTGLGGLLQLVLMGWAGIRLTPEELSITPMLPEQIRDLKIVGLHYKGDAYDLTITRAGHSLRRQA